MKVELHRGSASCSMLHAKRIQSDILANDFDASASSMFSFGVVDEATSPGHQAISRDS